MSRKNRKKKTLPDEDIDDMNIEDIDMDAVVTDSEEEYYTETERKLLEKARKGHTTEKFDSDDEVYALRDGSEEEEEDDQQDSLESDVEGLQEDYDMPNDRAWGKRAKSFYSSDYKYTDYASATQKDLANAEMEEQEAKKLHTRSADEIFNIIDDRFMQTIEDSKDDRQEDSQQILELNQLSRKRKHALEQKESKAFMVLLTDFKEYLTKAKKILLPFLELVEDGTCPNCNAVTLVKIIYHVILNYCINISFYLMLKVKRLSVQSHPVIKRLEQYRHLLGQLQSGQADLWEQVAEIVRAVEDGKPLYSISDDSLKPTKKKTKRLTSVDTKSAHQKKMVAQDEEEQLLSDNIDSTGEEESMEEEDLDNKEKYDSDNHKDDKNNVSLGTTKEEEKRAITYQMAKNRGLTPYRKKELRNPRVKHRNKYRKAKIRRKGAVREVRKELTRYTGEISGIKAGVKKSVKLKF